MTREEYLRLRGDNSKQLLYEFYKEKLDLSKYKMLTPSDFFTAMAQWPSVREAYHEVIAYYDAHFSVMKVQELSTGLLLKVY